MKKFHKFAALLTAGASLAVAAPAMAATTDLVFSDPPSLVSGPALDKDAVYRFSNISSGVDMLVTILDLSANTEVQNIQGDASFYTGAADNFSFQITRTLISETDTWARLKFEFVNSADDSATTLNGATFTFGDIDSENNMFFSDYVQFDPTQFSSLFIGSELSAVDQGNGEFRYLGDYNQPNYAYTSNDQPNVSVVIGLDGVSSFELVWGYEGNETTLGPDYIINSRAMLIDGSNELQITNAVPEPASMALVALGGAALLGTIGRRNRKA